MTMQPLVFLFLFFALPLIGSLEDLPATYEGRIRPFGVIKLISDETDPRSLPSADDITVFLPLSDLAKNEENFTAFTDADFKALKDAYHKFKSDGNETTLLEVYMGAYQKLPKTTRLSEKASFSLSSESILFLERLYYKIPLTSLATLCCLLSLLLALLASGFSSKILQAALFLSYGTAFLFESAALIMRALILSRPPVSNMTETLIYVPWVALLLGGYLAKSGKSLIPLFAGSALSAILLTILEWSTDRFALENVQPVLNSNLWLTVHVLMIVASYGVLLTAGVIGHILLLKKLFKGQDDKPLALILLKTLYIGVSLLIPGTILGGVWAAQSWGRFWDWDPKESWAFISACVYLIVIHAYRFSKIQETGLAIGALFGLLSISFTWYGVNYILGVGLHSYGFGNGGEGLYLAFVLAELVFIAISGGILFSRDKIKKRSA